MPDEEVYELDLPVRTDHFEFGEGEPEMKKNHLMFVLTLLLVFILAACSTPVDELQETVESAATDARMRLVEPVEKGMVLAGKQVVAEIVRGVAPHRHADRVEFAVDGIVVDGLPTRGLMQPRQRAREIGDTGERELIEGDNRHVVLTRSDTP